MMGLDAPRYWHRQLLLLSVRPERGREKSAPSASLANNPQYRTQPWLSGISSSGEGKGLRGTEGGRQPWTPPAVPPCQMSRYHVALQCHAVMALAGPHEWALRGGGGPGGCLRLRGGKGLGRPPHSYPAPPRPPPGHSAARPSGAGGARRCGRDGGGGAGPGKCGGHVAGVTWRGSRAQPQPPLR